RRLRARTARQGSASRQAAFRVGLGSSISAGIDPAQALAELAGPGGARPVMQPYLRRSGPSPNAALSSSETSRLFDFPCACAKVSRRDATVSFRLSSRRTLATEAARVPFGVPLSIVSRACLRASMANAFASDSP